MKNNEELDKQLIWTPIYLLVTLRNFSVIKFKTRTFLSYKERTRVDNDFLPGIKAETLHPRMPGTVNWCSEQTSSSTQRNEDGPM